MKKDRRSLQLQIDQYKESIEVAQEDSKKNSAKARVEIKQLQSDKEELESRLLRASQQAATSSADQEKRHAEEISKVIKDHEDAVSDLRSQVSTTSREALGLKKKKIDELEARLRQASEQAKEILKVKDEFEEEVFNLRNKNLGLRSHIEKANNEIVRLKKETDELNTQSQLYGLSVTDLSEQHERDAEVKQLQQQVKGVAKELQDAKNVLQAQYQAKVDELQKQRSNAESLRSQRSKHVQNSTKPEAANKSPDSGRSIPSPAFIPYPPLLTGLPSLLPGPKSALQVPCVKCIGVERGATILSHDPYRRVAENARVGSKREGHFATKDRAFVASQIESNSKFNMGIDIDKSQSGKRLHRFARDFDGQRRRRSVASGEQSLHMIRDYGLPRVYKSAFKNDATADVLIKNIASASKMPPVERRRKFETLYSSEAPAELGGLDSLRLIKATEAFFKARSHHEVLRTGTGSRITDVLAIDNLRRDQLLLSSNGQQAICGDWSFSVLQPHRSIWSRHARIRPYEHVELRIAKEPHESRAASERPQSSVDHTLSGAELDAVLDNVTRDAVILHQPMSTEAYFPMLKTKAQPQNIQEQSSVPANTPTGPRIFTGFNACTSQQVASNAPLNAPTGPRADSSKQSARTPSDFAFGGSQQQRQQPPSSTAGTRRPKMLLQPTHVAATCVDAAAARGR
jgi:hypothetical protein